ncbi:hypothetical protein BH11PLA2_BH11PLA2_22150 [soil metagenome]
METNSLASLTWDQLHQQGCASLDANNPDAAAELFRQALTVNTMAVPPRAMLAGILTERCDLDGAAEQYQLALRAGPDAKVRIAAATALPPIYDSSDHIDECRATLLQRLDALHAEGVTLNPLRGPIPNLFHLAYQGRNDRDVMQSFAKLFAPSPWATEPLAPRPAVDGRIRVGLISAYFCNHTIGTLNLGLVEQLDRQRFHVTVLAAARHDDETSREYRTHADRYIVLPNDIAAAVRMIRGLNLDCVLFTDLGMSCVTLALAHARLAPRQAVTWGHPLTTGIPTIDDFLSGSLFESEMAQGHYTERLVRLRGLQTYYPRPVRQREYTRTEFNLPNDCTLYGCPQTLFKLHPDMDVVFKTILESDPAGRLVLIEGRNKYWKERLLQRWQRTMPRVLSKIIWLPALDKARYLGLCSLIDVMLDPLHFGGGNTTLEALAMGTPVVTLPSPYLRSRLSLGFYQHMGMNEYVANNVEQYITIALDHKMHRSRREVIAKQCSALFQHDDSINAIEGYF